jgi:hypothetical protein
MEMISDCFSNALFRIKMILFPAKKKELDEFLEALEKSFEMHIKEGVDNENKS